MSRFNLGVTDLRKITGALNELGYPEFNDFALTSLRRQLEMVLVRHNLSGADAMVTRMSHDSSFIDSLIDELSVETTEMFRDASLWRLLRDKFLPKYSMDKEPVKFLIPGASSGEDLVSLMILLKEAGLKTPASVTVTSASRESLNKIITGVMSKRKLEINEANYKKFLGAGNLGDYLSGDEELSFRESGLLDGVNFIYEKDILPDYQDRVDFILYRDKLIYFNMGLSNKVLEKMYNNIKPGGYLIIGSGESLTHSLFDKQFQQADLSEKIYRKIR
jgi:chemotaxis protein methyltransferase CheR